MTVTGEPAAHGLSLKHFYLATVSAAIVLLLVILVSAPGAHESSIHLDTGEYILFFGANLLVATLIMPLANYAIFRLCRRRLLLHGIVSIALAAAGAFAFQPNIVQYLFRPADDTVAYWLFLMDILAFGSVAGIATLTPWSRVDGG